MKQEGQSDLFGEGGGGQGPIPIGKPARSINRSIDRKAFSRNREIREEPGVGAGIDRVERKNHGNRTQPCMSSNLTFNLAGSFLKEKCRVMKMGDRRVCPASLITI